MSKLAPKTRPRITLVVWIDNAKPFSNLCFLEVVDQYMIIIVHVPSRSVLVAAIFGFILSENSFATTPLASFFLWICLDLSWFFQQFIKYPALHKGTCHIQEVQMLQSLGTGLPQGLTAKSAQQTHTSLRAPPELRFDVKADHFGKKIRQQNSILWKGRGVIFKHIPRVIFKHTAV